jgi:hypothetical protein
MSETDGLHYASITYCYMIVCISFPPFPHSWSINSMQITSPHSINCEVQHHSYSRRLADALDTESANSREVDAVLAEWLEGNGRQPITRETMLRGLREADYCSIYGTIEEFCRRYTKCEFTMHKRSQWIHIRLSMYCILRVALSDHIWAKSVISCFPHNPSVTNHYYDYASLGCHVVGRDVVSTYANVST